EVTIDPYVVCTSSYWFRMTEFSRLAGLNGERQALERPMKNPVESSESSVSSEIESDLDLKKPDLALGQKELTARSAGETKNMWFTSPLVIGALTAAFGLLGTGVGAVLQGYWNTQLERQKFESVLIQKALEQKNRDEAAKSLIFDIKAGLIQSLNAE